MPNVTGYDSLVGTFIDSWSDSLAEPYQNLVPIYSRVKFEKKDETGGLYHQPVRMTFEGGQTFAPASTGAAPILPGTGGRTYVGARAGLAPDAQLQGIQIHGRSRVTYEAIARSMQNVDATAQDKKKAVQGATRVILDGLLQGTLKKVEALLIHGGEGIGQLDTSVSTLSNVVATTYEGVGGFHLDLSISASSWSEALWLSFEGHTFDLFADTAGLPSGTRLNTATNTALDGVGQQGFILTSANPATPLTNAPQTGRVLRFFHTSGTAGAAGTGVLGGWTTPATANLYTQHLAFESAGPGNEWVGLSAIGGNTGTYANLSASTYSMWRGNPRVSVGNIRLAELVRYCSPIINAGAQGQEMWAIVPTELFAQFANDESTLRRYGAESVMAKSGFSGLDLMMSQNTTLKIVGHGLQKDGLVTVFCPDEAKLIGSQDIGFVSRGGSRDQLIMEVAAQPSSEVRLFGQFAPLVMTPRHCGRFSGVTF